MEKSSDTAVQPSPKAISMLSIIILNNDEPTVVELTYDNLRRELLSVAGAATEIIISDSWLQGIAQAKGDYICMVEADCLVSSGYFSSNLGLFKRMAQYRKLAMMASCVGIDNWGNRVYCYRLEEETKGTQENSVTYWRVAADRTKRANGLYNVQIGFMPGAIIRKTALREAVKHVDFTKLDTVQLSTQLSFYFWNTGRRVMMNPNTTYVSTDKTLENPPLFDPKVPANAANIFDQEQTQR